MIRLTPFLLLLLASCYSCTNTSESAFFHGNAGHTGAYASAPLVSLHGIQWKYKTGGSIVSSPVISGNTVFFGSDDSVLYAVDAEKGTLRWKFRTGGRVSSSAAVDHGKVYFVSFDGCLYCLEEKTGRELWKFTSAGEKVFSAPGIHGVPEKDRTLDDPWEMYLSSPVVAEGLVFFGTGSGMFYAVDTESGKMKWEFKTGDVIHASPAYADSTVFFGSWDSYLYALHTSDGKVRWSFKTGTDTVIYNQVGFQSSPAVTGGTVYVGCRDAHVYAIDSKTGTLKWKYYNNGSWVIATPAVRNDTVYFTTSDTHKLIALQASDGRELYTGSCKTYGFSSPALAGDFLYAGNDGGSLMAFSTRNGQPVWEFRTQAAVENRDSLLNASGEFNLPKLFTENSYQGMLQSVDRIYSLGAILSSPAIHNGMVYFGSTDGNMVALY